MLLQFSIGGAFNEWVLPLVLFILGLGVVVFVHELGHFLAAKAVGIKVEQFAFGFGKRLFGFKMGETDYRVNLIPLGGYVKMLGQEDFKPLTENDKPNPRSYESKSVGARFFVIAAGVIMNIILSAVLFVTVGLVGREFLSPTMGDPVPGSPAFNAVIAWDTPPRKVTENAPGNGIEEGKLLPPEMEKWLVGAELQAAPDERAAEPPPFDPWGPRFQAGDRIVAMEGNSFVLGFDDGIASLQTVSMVAVLASPTDIYTFTIERTVDGVTRRGQASVGVFDNGGGMLQFGIGFPRSLTVADLKENSPQIAPFQANDEIVQVAGQHVNDQGQVRRIERELDGRPVDVVVRRKNEKKEAEEVTLRVEPTLGSSQHVIFRTDGTPIYFTAASVKDGKMRYEQPDGSFITLPADEIDTAFLRVLGMAPRLIVLEVAEGSNAERAGIKPGDAILSYGDRYLPTHKGLLEINKQHAGQDVKMEVLRGDEIVTLHVRPKQRDESVQIGLINVADLSACVVGDVLDGSVADRAGIAKGCTITAVNGEKVKTWTDLYRELASAGRAGRHVELSFTTRSGQESTGQIGELTAAVFHERHYEFSIYPQGLAFEPSTVVIKQDSIGGALVWGGKETIKLTLTSYASLRSLIAGSASVKHMAGPIGIGAMAVKAGQRGFVEFIYFIAFFSSAIAVFNFLPLPVLDGGHALFLIIEKIRGKPVPVKVLNYAQYIGLALLLCVFLAVTYQDIARLIGQWFW